ncbi:hypothetical protein J1605_008373 [Eschrichtius robustus]|uniref:SCAN domain-containing protein 3 n=1 Tax=Eschrichtius robustus TaxID=9764 RepID=A0AB34GZ59_ESCRO|nr:hypothetical protein J1605_008373 [Eschrichtius robustus]
MKPSKLLHHMEIKHPELKDKPLEFFKRKKKREHEEQKQLLKATTSSSVSALRASFLVANRLAKAKKPFTVEAELILPAAKDICPELLGEAAVQKVEDVHEDMLCALLLPTKTVAAELFKSLNDYISGKLNWSFCVSICTDGVAVMTGQLSGFTTRVKEVASECESTHCVIHREMLASRKMSPELNNVLQDVIRIINHIKLSKEFEYYFPTTKDPQTGKEWIRDPIVNKPSESTLFVLEEDQLLEVANDGGLKSMFETTSNLHTFWIKVKVE